MRPVTKARQRVAPRRLDPVVGAGEDRAVAAEQVQADARPVASRRGQQGQKRGRCRAAGAKRIERGRRPWRRHRADVDAERRAVPECAGLVVGRADGGGLPHRAAHQHGRLAPEAGHLRVAEPGDMQLDGPAPSGAAGLHGAAAGGIGSGHGAPLFKKQQVAWGQAMAGVSAPAWSPCGSWRRSPRPACAARRISPRTRRPAGPSSVWDGGLRWWRWWNRSLGRPGQRLPWLGRAGEVWMQDRQILHRQRIAIQGYVLTTLLPGEAHHGCQFGRD